MCKIAHIADVHIRGLTRHDEYRVVFEEFAEKVEQDGSDHIFVAGDLFHTKTSGISPEYIEFMTWWLKRLSSAAKLHIMLGNHDGNLVNLNRQDAITPIVEALRSDRISLYKKSGVYKFDEGFNWCIFSLFDEEGWKNVKPIAGDVNIACYHGPVHGATSETNWEITEGLKVDFFKDYDFAFLGDIHKTQFLSFRDQELIVNEDDLHLYPNAQILEEINDEEV